MWYEIDDNAIFVEPENEIKFLVENPEAVEIKNFNYWLEKHNIVGEFRR